MILNQRVHKNLPLKKALRVSKGSVIAFAGAGGKTTALFQLARELAPPVIVTATTHLGVWQIPLADKHIIAESIEPLKNLERGLSGVTLVTGRIGERTTPVSNTVLYWLREFCNFHATNLLIEADGSRQKPLKAPAAHEPAIPGFVNHLIYLAGLSGLGHPLSEENIHRPEIFANLSGSNIGDIVTAEALIRVLTHLQGGLKNIPAASKRTLILNQADTVDAQSHAGSISPALLKLFDSVIIASLQKKEIYAVHENVAGIILAAGASTRFGQPKQLLDWRGEPFIRVVAKTALSAGLSPVVIVTGANAEQVERAVLDLDVTIVRNPDWENGQSTSIKAGLSIVTPSASSQGATGDSQKTNLSNYGGVPQKQAGAAIFLLSDQPHIRPEVLRALVEVHARGLHPIVAPLVLEERRANPVLFDRVTFPDLMTLEGDVGGRAIFPKYQVEYLHWHDDRLLLDVDKPEDYQRLIEDETL
jgi:molybdenum cofactor cytidylyltransferase